MWTRRLALATITILLAACGLTPSAASAGGYYETFYGDLNNDSFADSADLVTANGGCAVRVRLGDGAGGYGAPTDHPFEVPGAPDPKDYHCPEVGLIIDLGGDGVSEILATWFAGTDPWNALLVLRNFQVVKSYPQQGDGSELGSADFNGDGLLDVYLTVAFADFYTLLNTPSGELVPGPMTYCAEGPKATLTDLDGNGATDVVLTHGGRCFDYVGGIVAILDDGTRIELREGDLSWQIQIDDVNRDGRPDVRTMDYYGNDTVVYVNRDGRSFVAAPVANDDLAHAYRNAPKVIKVRANDHASSTATLTVVTPPRYGHLSNHDPRYEIVYVRDAAHTLTDSFVYQLSQDGRTDTATVTIRMKD